MLANGKNTHSSRRSGKFNELGNYLTEKNFLKEILNYNFFDFNRRLFVTTLTELKAMAAPAIIGFSKKPFTGYRIPAATGIPMRL